MIIEKKQIPIWRESMKIKIPAAVLALMMLAGCGNTAGETDAANMEKPGLTIVTPEEQAERCDSYDDSMTAAFLSKIDAHDFAIKLSSSQNGGEEVIEEVEVSGNILHDIYKTSEGMVTAELYIVDGGIWCVTNEGSDNVTYQGFDNSYDDHVRECVFHCPGIGSKDKYAGMTDDHTDKILGQTNDTEYLFTYGDDGILKNCDGSGTHIEVLEFTDGIGSLQIPENVRAAIENKDLNG